MVEKLDDGNGVGPDRNVGAWFASQVGSAPFRLPVADETAAALEAPSRLAGPVRYRGVAGLADRAFAVVLAAAGLAVMVHGGTTRSGTDGLHSIIRDALPESPAMAMAPVIDSVHDHLDAEIKSIRR